ncbi:hypothetical protein GBA52_014121 [Prunus armeniaca]|nr:hypothetical protein GBA52_014121 [Prunus armeniaca]
MSSMSAASSRVARVADFQVYRCGGCGATLKARGLDSLPMLGNGSHDDNSDYDDQHYQTTGSDDSNPTKSLLLSGCPHADTDQDELGNVTRGSVDSDPSVSPLPCNSTHAGTDYDGLDSAGSDDSNLSVLLLPSSSPRSGTDYDEPGNLAIVLPNYTTRNCTWSSRWKT